MFFMLQAIPAVETDQSPPSDLNAGATSQYSRTRPHMLSHLVHPSQSPSLSAQICYFDRRPKMEMEVAAPSAAKPTTKVAALCGSLRKGSFNRSLLRAAMKISESIEGLEIEYIDISPLPMLNTDLEVGCRFPPVVEAFREKIRASDCVLFASPEYNYSVTAPLKNALDWASRAPNAWTDKSAAIISAGGGFGGVRGQYHLRQIGVYLDLHFINKPEFFLTQSQLQAMFDEPGNLVDEAAKEKLKQVLLSLHDFTLRLKGNLHRDVLESHHGEAQVLV